MESKNSFNINLIINLLFSLIPLIGELYLKELLNISAPSRIIIYLLIFIIINLLLLILPRDKNKYFPRLDIDILKERINRCVIKHSQLPIKQVTLFSYSSKYLANVPTKYAIVFRLSWRGRDIKESFAKHNAYDKFAQSTGWCATKKELEYFHDLGIDASFIDVYKEKPEDSFLFEWNFFCLLADEKYPIGVLKDSPYIELLKINT